MARGRPIRWARWRCRFRKFDGRAPVQLSGTCTLSSSSKGSQAIKPDVIHLWEEPWSLVALHAARVRNRFRPATAIVLDVDHNILKRLPHLSSTSDVTYCGRLISFSAAARMQLASCKRKDARVPWR
jgi:hypothetical protein